MKLNEKLLYVIVTIQDYKSFFASKNHLEEITQTGEKGKHDYYTEIENFYNSLDKKILHEIGLHKNKWDFDKIWSYNLTNEIKSTVFDELGKFEF